MAFCDEHGSMSSTRQLLLQPGGKPLRKRLRVILAQWAIRPRHPNSVGVALSGELGYTSGTTDLTFKDTSGKTLTKKGNYLTVWKKDADGSWKVLFDSFNYE